MKTNLSARSHQAGGYALLMVIVIIAALMVVMAGTLSRTQTVAKLNDRNSQYVLCQNAAEAATEKVYARLAYDFQLFGMGGVTNNLSIYRSYYPSEDSYWDQFQFSDAQGHANATYVNFLTNYTGELPSQYPGLFTLRSPVYRIVSNCTLKNARNAMTNAAQDDILLAMVPITTYAIFYNSRLEFSLCATMTVNGRVHANGPINIGTSASLTLNGTTTTTSAITTEKRDGNGPWTWPGNTYFKGNPTYKTNVPTVTVSINMTNTHSMIEVPPAGESPTSQLGSQRLYNEAQVVLVVTNSLGVGVSNNLGTLTIQSGVNGQAPGADPTPTVLLLTNDATVMTQLYPFLKITTNTFTDQRENKVIRPTQIDIGIYSEWLNTNESVTTKFPAGSGTWPTILYVADNRPTNSTTMNAVRITNGIAPPNNGGLGFTLATQNPLYVWGNYNQTNAAYLGTTNTSSGTVPCAFISDAITILSSAWQDSASSGSFTTRDAVNTTINAAFITGIVPSTSSGALSGQFSGGVHNLPRLLEDWLNTPGGRRTLTINTSIVNLFASTMATAMFRDPGNFGLANSPYYDPPTRQFSFDLNFMDPAKQPPGVPAALTAIRFNWAVPPPNTVTYNVVP
jgi:hypothetical protein